MPVYIRILQNGIPIPGTVRSGAHTPERTDLRSASPGPSPKAFPEVGDEVLVAFETNDRSSVSLGSWAKADGLDVTFELPESRTGGPAGLAAQINITRLDRSGREITELRVQLHDVRVVHSEHAPRAGRIGPVERTVIACSKMTAAGMLKSAPDISCQVREKVAKAQEGRQSPGRHSRSHA